MSDIEEAAPCIECGTPTFTICSWCSVAICEKHTTKVNVRLLTPGGLGAGLAVEDYCDSCMPDDYGYEPD